MAIKGFVLSCFFVGGVRCTSLSIINKGPTALVLYLEHVICVELVDFLQHRAQIGGSGLGSDDEFNARQRLEALELECVRLELFDTG